MKINRKTNKTSYRARLSLYSAAQNNRGSALFVVIIIIGILIIFAFSLLLVSYTLYASQNKRAASLKCSEAANSLSLALEDELEGETAYENSWLWDYLRMNLLQNSDVTWPYYDPGVTGHTSEYAYRYFDLKYNTNYSVDGFPGQIKLCMYWTLPEDSGLSDDEIAAASEDDKNGSHLYIEIICSSGSQSYTVLNKYTINVSKVDTSDTDDQTYMEHIDEVRPDTKKNPLGNTINHNEKWEFVFDGRE